MVQEKTHRGLTETGCGRKQNWGGIHVSGSYKHDLARYWHFFERKYRDQQAPWQMGRTVIKSGTFLNTKRSVLREWVRISYRTKAHSAEQIILGRFKPRPVATGSEVLRSVAQCTAGTMTYTHLASSPTTKYFSRFFQSSEKGIRQQQ